MDTKPITCEITRCERNAFGQLKALGGDGWLLEPGLVAADIAASGTTPGPYYVVSPTGGRNYLTVHQNSTSARLTFSTDSGDQPLMELPTNQTVRP